MSKVTLKSVSRKNIMDMGQCMCKRNCVRKNTDNTVLTRSVSKIYEMPKLSDLVGKRITDMG